MNADGIYNRRPWLQNVPAAGPTKSNYEQAITADALAPVMGESEEEIRERKPPLPIVAFPPRFGYEQRALGISDVAQVDRLYKRVDFSGKQSGYEGTSVPSLPAF